MENLRDPIHQSDMLINVDKIDEDLKGLLDDESSGLRTVTFNQSLLSPFFTPFKQLKQDSKLQSMPIDNGKKL
ncbi:hypothetical protein RCL_jg4455.t1 [Rhizophagus clarus]|uniref:Uncharacterized protein n=1 Tax=Rhizophagus clarus TaxID=94130 RepID=A0A8H3KW51_9GLOM|nr:hypothetical protein RCL_jg4455.t1 [Rhizophagus clarus]